jgi:hypothetical protein
MLFEVSVLKRLSSLLRRDAARAAVHWPGNGRVSVTATRPAGAIASMDHSRVQDEAATFIERSQLRAAPADPAAFAAERAVTATR